MTMNNVNWNSKLAAECCTSVDWKRKAVIYSYPKETEVLVWDISLELETMWKINLGRR